MIKDISKYLTNKELELSNDDLDIEKLSKDLLKGYVKESEVEKPDYSGYVAKADFDKLQSDYSSLETNYNNTVKTLSDTNEKMARVNLESIMVRKGFKDENFDEVAKLRTSLYAETKDDKEAVDLIAEKFKGTYFSNPATYTPAPNEAGMEDKNSTKGEATPISINRKTSLKDLMVKK